MKNKTNIWMSFTDLMTVLSILFLMISLTYMLKVKKINDEIANVQANIHNELQQEFSEQLEEWNAVLMKEDLTIRFLEPDIVFKKGSSELKDEFKAVLDEFLPKYIEILMKPEFRNEIAEVKIKGHTSSEWAKGVSEKEAYIKNMELSQGRSREVLSYWLSQNEDMTKIEDSLIKPSSFATQEEYDEFIARAQAVEQKYSVNAWIIENVTANGLSFSKKILNEDGTENEELSRRVEFQIVTKTEERMSRLTK